MQVSLHFVLNLKENDVQKCFWETRRGPLILEGGSKISCVRYCSLQGLAIFSSVGNTLNQDVSKLTVELIVGHSSSGQWTLTTSRIPHTKSQMFTNVCVLNIYSFIFILFLLTSSPSQVSKFEENKSCYKLESLTRRLLDLLKFC